MSGDRGIRRAVKILLATLVMTMVTGLAAFGQIGGASAPEILTVLLALWAGLALAAIAFARARS